MKEVTRKLRRWIRKGERVAVIGLCYGLMGGMVGMGILALIWLVNHIPHGIWFLLAGTSIAGMTLFLRILLEEYQEQRYSHA